MSADLLFTRDRAAPFRWHSRNRLIWHPQDVVNHYSTPDLGDLDRVHCRVPSEDHAYDIEIHRAGPASLRLHLTIPPGCEVVLSDRTLTAGTHHDLLIPAQ